MTVVTDQNIKICSFCKRPAQFISKDELNGRKYRNIRKMPVPIYRKRLGLIRCFMPSNLNPRIECILYWRDTRKTLMAFMAGLMLLTSITYYSLLSVVTHLSLALLTSTFILRISGRIFGKTYLVLNWPKCDNLDEIAPKVLNKMLLIIADIRDVIFVKDLFRTLKFCFIFHIWTIIGDWMNGFTLLVGIYISLFIIPKSCEVMWPKILEYTERGIRYCKSKIPFLEVDD